MKVSALFAEKDGKIKCLLASPDAQQAVDLFNDLRSKGGNGYQRLSLVIRPLVWKEARFNDAVAVSPPRKQKL